MWDFVMDKSGAGAGFLRELRFPVPIYIPSASPQSSSLSNQNLKKTPEKWQTTTDLVRRMSEDSIRQIARDGNSARRKLKPGVPKI
jgi:hypothetical protein